MRTFKRKKRRSLMRSPGRGERGNSQAIALLREQNEKIESFLSGDFNDK